MSLKHLNSEKWNIANKAHHKNQQLAQQNHTLNYKQIAGRYKLSYIAQHQG